MNFGVGGELKNGLQEWANVAYTRFRLEARDYTFDRHCRKFQIILMVLPV